jgi:NAD(P)-dependent dehydrogenase (short-subunit alcohol dehydrogenase family)
VNKAEASFGRLDVLVNNAGIFPFSSALETSEELWQRVQDVNLKGPFFFAQAAVKVMRKGGSGGGSVLSTLRRSTPCIPQAAWRTTTHRKAGC